ncbi:amidohydrolase family protein [Ferrimicrobium acidiphilum]|uniref:Amidohydrolase family protein n=1 Tax=Ferrimicrobium acidiphilum TaxID=121039 RepID=A0ABV3Y833_9ACTN
MTTSDLEPTQDLRTAIAEMPLVDHHCHSFFSSALDDQQVENSLTESPNARAARTSTFDSNLGLAMLRWVGPAIFGLEPPVSREDYLKARRSIAPHELITRALAIAGVSDLLVDTGFQPDELVTTAELAGLGPARVHEILRVEYEAERLLTTIDSPEQFLSMWPSLLAELGPQVVGLKSVAAYRCGLGLLGETPLTSEVLFGLGHELERRPLRLTDPTVISYLVTTAIEITHLPVQFHVGIGDPDVRLETGRPGHLQRLIEFALSRHTAICLLHCYPYHREAALLAHDYPNVFLDLGLTLNFVGANATHVLAETLELAPYAKLLYSSDAFGLAELNYLGALQFRRALTEHLTGLVQERYLSQTTAIRLAKMMGHETANALYRLPRDA